MLLETIESKSDQEVVYESSYQWLILQRPISEMIIISLKKN